MRLRNVSNAKDLLAEHPNEMILNPYERKGKWSELFGNSNPIHLEIGMGKGQFVCGTARKNPAINYIGIEKFDTVALRALQNLTEQKLPNVRLIRADALGLSDMFEPSEVSRLYLNFSDPWPKAPHAKRRLTHRGFLARYGALLGAGGEVHFKTDNRSLFEFSLLEINNYGMTFEEISLNLHENEPADNVRTEYEIAWSARGFPIYKIVARFRS